MRETRPDLVWAERAGRAEALLRMILNHQQFPGLLQINLDQAREFLDEVDAL